MHEALAGLVILSAVNGAITWIVTESELFEPLRVWASQMNDTLGSLLSCPLCAGTWIGFGIAGATVWRVGYSGVDAVLAFIVVTFASLMGGLLMKRWASY